MMKLSIVVPVYNSEKYLSKCLDSLIYQDILHEDYEILIIDDGSTDKSREIAISYVNNYKNIIHITQENIGVGAARNSGLKQSRGKYVLFVDSDDYIKPNCFSCLLDSIEINKLDLLRFNYSAISEKGEIIPKKKNSTFSTVYDEYIVEGELFLTEYLGWGCYSWQFLYKASFLKENSLRFNPAIYFEDVDWIIRVLPLSHRVASIDKQVYFYLQRTGSITNSITIEKKHKVLTDKLYNIETLNRISETTLNKKLSLWCKGMITLTFMGILSFSENELPESKKEMINFLYEKNFIPLKSYRFTLKQKRDLMIINFSPYLYCFLKRYRTKH